MNPPITKSCPVPKDVATPGPFDSNFLRAAREMTMYRPHLNACSGSESLKRKKRFGERRINYQEVVGFLVNARKDGARRGVGAEAVALLLNEIIRDTLPEGAPMDVICRPVDGDLAALRRRTDEELSFSVHSAELITTVEVVVADGRIDTHEARLLEGCATKTARSAKRLVAAARAEARA